MPFLPDLETEADIIQLVDAFYARVNADALLRPIFNDVAQVDWASHLPTMYDFWSSVLLGWAFAGESLSLEMLGGAALIVLAVVLVLLGGRK